LTDAIGAVCGQPATPSPFPCRSICPVAAKLHAAKGKKVAPKYRGPGGETWSGRGLAPRWLADLEGKGKKRESYLIKT